MNGRLLVQKVLEQLIVSRARMFGFRKCRKKDSQKNNSRFHTPRESRLINCCATILFHISQRPTLPSSANQTENNRMTAVSTFVFRRLINISTNINSDPHSVTWYDQLKQHQSWIHPITLELNFINRKHLVSPAICMRYSREYI